MEEWKAIPGYEGIYEASNYGRIRSVEGKTTSSKRFKTRVWKQRILKFKFANRKGGCNKDARVCLWKDGTEKTFLVARLVAMTWCDGFYSGLTVNHKDGNPLNNYADNLEWVTMRENIVHAYENCINGNQKHCTLVDEAGNKHWFHSMGAASRYIGRNSGYVSGTLLKNKPIISATGERYDTVRGL